MIKPIPFIEDLIPYIPGKPVEELERELGVGNAVKIASNENPLGPSPLALKALGESLGETHRYPDGDAFYLKSKVSDMLQLKPETLIFGNGSNDVLDIAARTFMCAGDEAVMGEFAFIVYPIVTQAVGAKAVISPMPDYTHDLGDMYSRITPATKIVFIANPNNPTGTMVKRDEVLWFLDKVPDDVLVVIDEAYFEYVDDPDYPNTLEYHSMGKSILTVRTFSKIYGLAGLRLGYGVADEKLISDMHRVRQPFNVSSVAQKAGIAALDDSGHVRRSKELNREGLDYLRKELGELGIKYAPTFTNFILIDLKIDPMPIYDALMREGVIVRPVTGYRLKTHLRVTAGLPDENVKFINALRKVLNK